MPIMMSTIISMHVLEGSGTPAPEPPVVPTHVCHYSFLCIGKEMRPFLFYTHTFEHQ